jgi:hypothetical protein
MRLGARWVLCAVFRAAVVPSPMLGEAAQQPRVRTAPTTHDIYDAAIFVNLLPGRSLKSHFPLGWLVGVAVLPLLHRYHGMAQYQYRYT